MLFRADLPHVFNVLNRLKKYKFGSKSVEVVRQWGIMDVNQKVAEKIPQTQSRLREVPEEGRSRR